MKLIVSPLLIQPSFFTKWFILFSFCFFAVSVNLGVAFVSISKVLILSALILIIPTLWKNKKYIYANDILLSNKIILFALIWISFSYFWTTATATEANVGLARHSRILILPVSYLLINLIKESRLILKYLVLGQLFVVVSSWIMYFGFSLPWAKTDYPTEMGILFSSTLEQPVMSSLMLVIFWYLHPKLFPKLKTWTIWTITVMVVANVFFVMTGRTGYVAMFIAVTLAVWFAANRRQRLIGIFLILFITLVVGLTSTRLQKRVEEVKSDIVSYTQGNIGTSQGQRLDYWHRSLLSIAENPLVGHGVGSWRKEYLRWGGVQADAPSNPHNQYLLWAVEGGLVGLALMIGILVALYKDSQHLDAPVKHAMVSTLAIVATMGLFNCPFFGAGMGEFFLLLFGSFLAMGQSDSLEHQKIIKINPYIHEKTD